MLVKKSLNGVEILSVDKDELEKRLKDIAYKIKKGHPEVREVILFGSFCKGDYTPYSDIDIAIIVDKTEKRFIERQDDFVDYFLDITACDTNLAVYTTKEVDEMVRSGNRFIMEIEGGARVRGTSPTIGVGEGRVRGPIL